MNNSILITLLLIASILQIVLPSMVINAINNGDKEKALKYLIAMIVFNAISVLVVLVYTINPNSDSLTPYFVTPFAFNLFVSARAYYILNSDSDSEVFGIWWWSILKTDSEKMSGAKGASILSLIVGLIFSIIFAIVGYAVYDESKVRVE